MPRLGRAFEELKESLCGKRAREREVAEYEAGGGSRSQMIRALKARIK